MDASYKYVKENNGIDTENLYPYDSANPKVWSSSHYHRKVYTCRIGVWPTYMYTCHLYYKHTIICQTVENGL